MTPRCVGGLSRPYQRAIAHRQEVLYNMSSNG